MVIVKCSAEGCDYQTQDLPPDLISTLLQIHAQQHMRPMASKGPKLNRPVIDVGVDEETWNAFIRRWDTFRIGSNICEDSAPTQLFQCTSESLGDLLLKSDPTITTRPVKDVLAAMRAIAVIPVARGVTRAELIKMVQSSDEPIRTFAARVRGKAETCGFTTSAKCECGKTFEVDYTCETVRDVLLAGINDLDIRREALSDQILQSEPINKVITFIESREMARNATPVSAISTLSSYRREQQPKPDISKTIPCPTCAKPFHRFRQKPGGGTNRQPYKLCIDCWRASKQKSVDVRSQKNTSHNSDLTAIESEEQISQISALETKTLEHPKVPISIQLAEGNTAVWASVEAIADTGAQTNVWGLEEFLKAGFAVGDLRPSSMKIRAANASQMNIVGQFKGVFKGKSPCGENILCEDIVIVSDSVKNFFLSCNTMKKLFIIDNQFPIVGHVSPTPENKKQNEFSVRALSAGCGHPHDDLPTCNCPPRTVVPDKPKSLPFDPIPENNAKMKQWLLHRYASSTFNTCPHRALPCMTGPPMAIHIDESATPKVCHKPAPVPLHWQQRVYEDLLRDEALGVIERVPDGVPVTWCHRMVVTRKHDGTPRRTVDLSPLNKHCKRETFPSEAPFHLARRVPGNTWKTVTDMWNGYHSVPLRECDRHLTTFITPFGRWRYLRAPQGFLSSGDGYNRRFDAILSNFQRKERCVDDIIHYDEDLEDHWWRTIDLLHTTGLAGGVMNPEKLQFAVRVADFAGFHITENCIEPLPKYLDAIRSFPTPKSTKDIRSWFGLVNQVSNYAQLRDFMEIFRPFLSPKYRFFWSPVLDKAFQESKEKIIAAIREGVEIFDPSKATCLRPDWSLQGIGYFLLQKHCNCVSDLPNCCINGWRITLAGSRFLTGAEKRYAAIEGEALAIAWGLEQTRYFTQGCHDLLIVTDHKPLTKIFGDRTLDEIYNTRLFRLKQRTLPWHFQVKHLPGKTNLAADATSRYPAPSMNLSTLTVADQAESLIAAAISSDTEEITSLSWELLAKETMKDPVLSLLMTAIDEEFTKEYPQLSEYMRYKDHVYVSDGVLLYNDRVIIPTSLRQTALENLHAAHQGISSMQTRAQSIMFWPGMTVSIQETRAKCGECNRNAPSQAPMPSEPAIPPSTPFEHIFGDFFEFGGRHYLVVGDRLSGWSEVFSTPTGTSWSGARGLIACLRSFIATFGAPDELSSDGGPEFTASLTTEFLKKWGIRHRVSSAYHPKSNGRAEVAVKSAKRLLRANVNHTGSLDNDKFLRALLQLRNTPDPDCDLSPAQIIFGRPLRDSFQFINRLEKFANPHIRPMWRDAWSAKEEALRTRFTKSSEKLNEHAVPLPPLKEGDKCFIQNQTGKDPKKWYRTGTVVETCGHDQYMIRVDGSGRITKRNRQFLRAFKPASSSIDQRHSIVISSAPESKAVKVNEYPTDTASLINPRSQFENQIITPVKTIPEPQPVDEEYPQIDIPCERPENNRAPVTPKIPAMLKRLFSHNEPGRLESTPVLREGRTTRSGLSNSINMGGL